VPLLGLNSDFSVSGEAIEPISCDGGGLNVNPGGNAACLTSVTESGVRSSDDRSDDDRQESSAVAVPEGVETLASNHELTSEHDGALRMDPDTGQTYTFAQFEEAFADRYTAEEIRDYWQDACLAQSSP